MSAMRSAERAANNMQENRSLDVINNGSGLRNQMGFVETDGKEYNGVSNLYSRKKSIKNNDFQERFQGR